MKSRRFPFPFLIHLSTRPGFLLGLTLLSLTLTLLLAAGCSQKGNLAPSMVKTTVSSYASETECAACHAEISSTCRGTNHALTLRNADKKSLGNLSPPAAPVKGTNYSVRADGDQLIFVSSAGNEKEIAVDLALGSGKLGMTYVSLRPDNTLTELRMSWYPNRKKWYITPGQENIADNEPGDLNDVSAARSCLGCHSTTLPADGPRPETRFFGVGCQSCHGPASAHLEAVKAGQFTNLRIEKISSWGATKINSMCGRCHRNPDHVGTTGDEVTLTQRFQPFGLSQSRCFRESGDKLSCITCHNPHKNTSKDEHSYEAACLRCHSPVAKHVSATNPISNVKSSGKSHNRVCPINPRNNCVGCHMPARKVFPVSKIPISMADHLIWPYRKNNSGQNKSR